MIYLYVNQYQINHPLNYIGFIEKLNDENSIVNIFKEILETF